MEETTPRPRKSGALQLRNQKKGRIKYITGFQSTPCAYAPNKGLSLCSCKCSCMPKPQDNTVANRCEGKAQSQKNWRGAQNDQREKDGCNTLRSAESIASEHFYIRIAACRCYHACGHRKSLPIFQGRQKSPFA